MEKVRAAAAAAAVMVWLAGCTPGAPPGRLPAPVPPATEVSGLGAIQSQADATGAVATLTPDSGESPYANLVEQLFRGRIPGLHVVTAPDGTQSVRIRGLADDVGYGQSPEPLVVVDGMPAQGGVLQVLGGLDPSQIAKIQVLKDVSSTVIYGTRGAGGVILVTMRNQ